MNYFGVIMAVLNLCAALFDYKNHNIARGTMYFCYAVASIAMLGVK